MASDAELIGWSLAGDPDAFVEVIDRHESAVWAFLVRRDQTGMEEEMEELYTEGVATHGDPESCVGAREGDGEALTGARAGRAIEPRNNHFGVPTPSRRSEGNIAGSATRELPADPARSENQGMHGTSVRENREVPRLARPADHEAGRSGKAKVVRLR